MDFQDYFIYSRTIPAREGEYAPFPENLHPLLGEALNSAGITSLYSHQAEMFRKACEGKDLVITTSTASGKTLSFLLPVIQRILEQPQTRAIFIYPTKALAADQYRAMKPFLDFFGEDRICAGVYDGDTPTQTRSMLRRKANILLTNPEMLSGSFLPNHSRYGFDFIFSTLAFVVIDELHTYRGVFGSHMSNVFRRLHRLCRYYGSHPQILCSSATIANPVELASLICSREFEQISRDGSPAAERSYVLVQPPRVENDRLQFESQMQASSVAAAMIPQLLEEGHSFIAFAGSRRTVEVILREARDKLDAAGFLGTSDANRIAGYRGGYTPLERRAIEQKMVSGELAGLVSTNALELGIDIGHVDTTILTGYPGTRASFWQQTGRAGRSRKASTSYLILASRPIDQYIAVNPRWLFEESCENAVCDRDNLLIELSHIRAAAAELPLSMGDIGTFPDLAETIPVLLKIGELRSENGKFLWTGNAFPAGDFSMRGIDQKRYKLINRETNEVVTEMDEIQAFRELHEGAIYLHEGEQYQILKLDTESRTADAIPFSGNYYTMPGVQTEIRVLLSREKKDCGLTSVFWGDVHVDDTVFMYKKLQFHNHQNLGYEKLTKPLIRDFDSESCCLLIPPEVVKAYRNLLKPDSSGALTRNNHFDGMCHALKTAARLVTMTEEGDLGATMSANAEGIPGSQTAGYQESPVYLYLYDRAAGGLGYAQKTYEHIEEIIDAAVLLTKNCSCRDGCAVCVGDYHLDRKLVLWGLQSLRETLPVPQGYKYVEYAERPVIQKAFQYLQLQEKWPEFTSFIGESGESFSGFFTSVKKVEVKRDILTLYAPNQFFSEWAMQDENRRAMLNVIRTYTDAPASLKLQVTAEEDAPESGEYSERGRDLKDALQRRYERSKKQDDED